MTTLKNFTGVFFKEVFKEVFKEGGYWIFGEKGVKAVKLMKTSYYPMDFIFRGICEKNHVLG